LIVQTPHTAQQYAVALVVVVVLILGIVAFHRWGEWDD
jgi:hypothetical protein